MMYKLYIRTGHTTSDAAMSIGVEPQVSFIFDLNNTDYQQFKAQVLAGAELQDADGNVMTQEQADDFIKELP